MRLLTYNVRSLRDDRDAVASVIRASRPDVVCLQEAPRLWRWRTSRAGLARDCGLVLATHDRVGGLALMTALRVRVLDTAFARLSKRPRLHQRAVVSARVEVDGLRYAVASIHLSLDATERLRHLPEIWAALSTYPEPLVVAGDVNERPGEPVWRRLEERLVDAGGGPTYSARNPHKRVDGVFVDRRLEVVSCHVPSVPGLDAASDHLPLLTEIRPR